MSKRNQISYIKPEPAFLRRIREQVGYKDVVNVDTKKQDLNQDNLEDGDDEKPTIVITENSNVSKEEQEDFAEKLNEVKPTKILFKKPIKKDSNDKESDKNKSTLKRPLDDNDDDKIKKIKQKADNNRLLSFGDDDDDDEDDS